MSRAEDTRYLTRRLAEIGGHARNARAHLSAVKEMRGDDADEEWLNALDDIVKVLDSAGGIRARWERLSDAGNKLAERRTEGDG